jgi:predicted chitinase
MTKPAKHFYAAMVAAIWALVAAREQIYLLLKDSKWIIAVSLVVSALLGLPDQSKELYRIAYSDIIVSSNGVTSPDILTSLSTFMYLHVPIILIGLIVWWGGNQIVTETRASIKDPEPAFVVCAQILPALLFTIPLLGCVWGLYEAVPVRVTASPPLVGSAWEQYDDLLQTISRSLYGGALIQLIAVVVIAAQWRRASDRLKSLAKRLNQVYYGHWPGIIFTLLLLTLITAVFVIEPVWLPQAIRPFFVVMLFAICLTSFVVNFTLLSIRFQAPIISVLTSVALLFSLLDWTDNHAVRLASKPSQMAKGHSQRTASAEFEIWLKSRPDRDQYPGAYPVYVVAAQGGGIYAAYHTAIFLARMQDICPSFRHHLFAISGVSGGSIGAATFVAALRASDQKIIDTVPDAPTPAPPPAPTTFDPCPAITAYNQEAALPRDADRPGPLENAVRKALRRDFLSPLVAAALFPDFTQQFLFFPVGPFDRARALEYTLEDAGTSFIKAPEGKTPSEVNPFEASILDLWNASASESIPALLMNTTDAGSGRRFLIAPFRMARNEPDASLGALVDYQFWDPDIKAERDLRLSTAAVLGARFPWITPAATVEDRRFPNTNRVKLVDGGYVDNSGVETILDLKDSFDGIIKRENINLSLIVLSGGDFPVRKSFALGESMEPIRALLNARTSRAYVAIGRAQEQFPSVDVKRVTFADKEHVIRKPALTKAVLESRFYPLPLGWMLSAQTQAIIEHQSGRFWECTPDANFAQAQHWSLSQADCVQLLLYHDLNRSVAAVAEHIAMSNYLISRNLDTVTPDEKVLACYRKELSIASGKVQNLQLEQTSNMRALLAAWRKGHGHEQEQLLAYVMATAAYETNDFRTRRESLDYTSPRTIRARWPSAFRDISDAEIERLYVRKPRELAEKVYGGANGNGTNNGDSWLYRGRGLAMVTWKDSYLKHQKEAPGLLNDPELIFIPDINARIFLADYFPESKGPEMQQLLLAQNWHDLRQAVARASGAPMGDVEQIREKTKMFQDCIGASQ